MKRLLNTLYVTTEGAGLRKDGENVVVEIDGGERGRVPLHLLGSLVAFGGVFASPALLGACAAAGIAVVFLDRSGRFQARVEGPVAGNVLLRRAQYRASDAPEPIVRAIVVGKVAGNGAVLALTDRKALLVDDREWRPQVERIALDASLQVQGWQDDRTASLTLVTGGRQLVIDQIVDRPLAVEMAQRIRYRTGTTG